MDFSIEYAEWKDLEYLKKHDKHIQKEMLEKKIQEKEVLVAKSKWMVVGWLRFNYFWDNTPFINMLFVLEDYRWKWIGKSLLLFCEKEMKARNYKIIMTSTLSHEDAKDFYKKQDYKEIWYFHLPKEGKELVCMKSL